MSSISVKITATADDGTEAVGDFFDDGTLLGGTWAAGFDTVTGFIYLRFLGIGIPAGSTISAATVTCNVTTITGTPDTAIFGVDVDDAAAFSDPGNLPSNASTTTASADADPSGTGTHVIDVTGIVAEIVARAGWASGNDMAFVIKDNAGVGENMWYGEDLQAAGSNEAQLDVTYSAGGGGSTPAQAQMRNFRGIEPGAQIGGQ